MKTAIGMEIETYEMPPDAILMSDVSQMSGPKPDNETMVDSVRSGLLANTFCRRALLISGLAAVLSGFPSPVSAQLRRRRRRIRRRALRRFRRRGGRVQARAREAVQSGEIRPLREVIRAVKQRSNAEVLDVDLHERPRGWIYALRVMTPQGRVRDVFLDAKSLELLHLTPGEDEGGVPLPPELSQPQPQLAPEPKTPPPPPTPPPPSRPPQ